MRVTVAPDVALHVPRWDGGDGVPFLLVHGLASNCRTWEGVADRLHALGHPVASVDQRGHGRSDKPDDGYDFATMCDDLIVVLDAVGFERAVVAGQSTGGNIAVELGARRPDRVAAVVGVDGGSLELFRQFPVWEDCEARMAPPRLAGTPGDALESRIRDAHPDWAEWAIEATMANFERLPDGTIRPWLTFERHIRILRALWEHRPSMVVPRLEPPLLLALADSGGSWTDQKRVMADELIAVSPRVEVEWFSPGDHDLHLQFPVELADLLHRFSVGSGPLLT
jgi:pimeloyl-ACP methyl ester carboxylesterase